MHGARIRCGRALVVLAASALLLGAAGCGEDDEAGGGSAEADTSVPDTADEADLPALLPALEELELRAAARRFVRCLEDEGLELPGPGGGPGSRLEALRALDPGDGAVAEAVRSCFPALADEFVKAGLRPPTQGTVASSDDEVVLAEPGAPFYEGDFADPAIVDTDDGTYLYATNTIFQNVPVAELPSEPGALEVTDAMPDLPGWTEPGAVWAPGVAQVDDGFVLYFTSRHVESGRQCIGVATSAAPTGPFVATAEEPWICPLALGGAIDASPVVDGDSRYVVWKGDGNCCGIPTPIFVQQTDPTGTELVGEPVDLVGVDQPWEGELVEGPALVAGPDGRWLLFYSANRWDTADYAVGLAVCESVTGPCSKPADAPWLATYATAAGPGGQELSVGPDGEAHVVYHGWLPDLVGYDVGGVRRLYLEPVDLGTATPSLLDR